MRDTDLTIEEITFMAARNLAKRTARDTKKTSKSKTSTTSEVHDDPDPPKLTPSYQKLRREWNSMIDNFVEEWRTLNIVSAVLVP